MSPRRVAAKRIEGFIQGGIHVQAHRGLSVLAAVLFACGGSLTATPTPAAGATETPGGGGDLGSSGSGTDIVISLGTSS